MLNATNGVLTFDEPAVTIAPALTRDEFLSSRLAEDVTTFVVNEPYHSWKLGGQFRSSGVAFVVVLWFHSQRLTAVSLMDANPCYGASWADWSFDSEMSRQASHDSWLNVSLGEQRVFCWGRVGACYDERGGFSSIQVRYIDVA